MFTQLLQWLKYGIVILVGLALLWTMREPIAAFLRELMELISELFGGQQQSETNTNNQQQGRVEEVVQHRRFSEFINPLDDDATNWKSKELIQYSFQALEAWAHDQGVARQREQTSHEFVESLLRLGLEFPNEARQLAKLHTQVSYSTQPLATDSDLVLKSCWAMMSSSRLPLPTSMESASLETTSKEDVS